MKLPFRITIGMPDGSEHPVGSIVLDADGTVRRLTTIPEKPWGEYYALEGADLDRVIVRVYTPQEEW